MPRPKKKRLSPQGQALVDEVDQLAEEVLLPEKEPVEPMSELRAKRLKITANVFYCITVGVCLLLSAALLLNAYASNGIAGVRFFVETTNSMLKEVPRGSLMITATRDSSKIKPGDIITYHAVPGEPDTRLTRIVAERLTVNEKPLFVTKRSGSAAPDSMQINMTQILGVKVAILPGAGYVISFMQAYAAGFAVLAAALCISAVALRRWVVREQPDLKRKEKKKRKGRGQHAAA